MNLLLIRRYWWKKAFDLGYLISFIPAYLDTLREWGWTDYLRIKKYTMPEIIKHFYFFGQDKNYDDKGAVVCQWDASILPTKLFNEKIIITAQMVNEIIGVNVTDGPELFPKMNAEERMKFAKIVFKKEHLDTFPRELIRVSNLDVPERILHYIVANSFFGRSRASEVTDLDLFCMSKIMKEEPLNLGAFMVAKMGEACVRVRGDKPFHCPYGKLITLLCEQIFGESRLRGMERVEAAEGDGLRDTVNLMSFEFRGVRRISPGFENLDQAIADILSGNVQPKRKRGQKKYRMKGLPIEGLIFGQPSGQKLEVSSEEVEEEGAEPVREQNVGGGVTNEMIMNTLVQGFARIDAWREEVDVWRGIVDSRLQSMEEFHYGRRFDGFGPSKGGDDSMEP